MKTTSKIVLIHLIIWSYIASDGVAQKTDQLLLNNGDLVTGEIKKLDYGKVTFKTDAAGTLSVKWENILKMRSDKIFEVWLGRGSVYYGSFDTTASNFEVRIVEKEDTAGIINMNRIVEFSQLKSRFWARMDGNFDLGYQFTKGSQVTQFNSSYFIEYKASKSVIQSSANVIVTRQPERNDSKNQSLDINYRYLLPRNLSTLAFTSAQQNTELGIDLRLSLGAGMSKNWIKSNSQRFITTLGALVNRESGLDTANATVNYEGLIYIQYRAFRYRDPEMDINSTYGLLPSFTVAGRYRWEFNTKIRFEIFKDFFIGLTFYHNLDSKPPNEAATSSDWGIVTSIGYTF